MKQIMDDYNKGHQIGFSEGKKFAQKEVLKLMDEVIAQYESTTIDGYNPKFNFKVRPLGYQGRQMAEIKDKVTALKFMKNWVLSGGHEDEDGNRVCLVW